MRAIAIVALCAAAFVGAGAVALAQPPAPTPEQIDEARRWFETGRERYQAGQWREALDSFQRAYDLTRSPEILFNIGQCADRLRLDREAVTAFELYLERLPQAPDRASVEARIRVLRAEIARAEELQRQRDEDARQAALRQNGPVAGPRRVDDEPGVLGQWWFWTIAVVVVGGGIAATLVLTHDPEPIPGSDGSVITTLVAP